MNEQMYFLSRMKEDSSSNDNVRFNEFKEREIAEKRTVLWHYTNSEALFKIFSGRKLKFSRIDCVNDLMEKELLDVNEMYLRTYVSCFTHDEKESIPLWHMYTEKDNGVRVEFEFENNMIHDIMFDDSQQVKEINKKICWNKKVNTENEIGVFRMIRDVLYTDDTQIRQPYHRFGDELGVFPDFVGVSKSPLWDYEKETRIVLFANDVLDNLRNIYIPINFNVIKRIKVVFNPWMSSEMKKSIELTANYYLEELKNKISFSDSNLSGKITRK